MTWDLVFSQFFYPSAKHRGGCDGDLNGGLNLDLEPGGRPLCPP